MIFFFQILFKLHKNWITPVPENPRIFFKKSANYSEMLFISTTITSPKQAKRDVRAAMMTYPSISWQKYSFLPYLIKYLATNGNIIRFYLIPLCLPSKHKRHDVFFLPEILRKKALRLCEEFLLPRQKTAETRSCKQEMTLARKSSINPPIDAGGNLA